MSTNWTFRNMNRNQLFWFLHCVFWIFHWSIWNLMNPFYTAEWHNFWFHFVYYIGPVFFSLILRYIYKKYRVHLISPFYIVFLVALLSVTCGMLWLCEQFLLEKIFFGQFTFNVIDMTVVRSIWYKSYPFVMWSIIYLALKVNE